MTLKPERVLVEYGGDLTRLGAILYLWLERQVMGRPIEVSQNKLAARWGLNRKTVRGILEEMERLGVLREEGKTNVGARIYNVRIPGVKVEETNGRKSWSYPPEFESTWKLHPKGSKRNACTAWRRQVDSGKDPAYIEAQLQKLVDYYERTETPKKFQKHLSTWLSPDEEYVERQEAVGEPKRQDGLASAEELQKTLT